MCVMARPRKPLLSSERIVDDGAARSSTPKGWRRVSTRRLAAELGVSGPSLYNHFRTKDEILDAVADAVIAQVDLSMFEDAARTGATALLDWAVSYRAALAAHPNIVPFLARGPGRRPAGLRMADAVFGGDGRGGLAARPGHPHRRADAVLRHRLRARLVRPRLRRRRERLRPRRLPAPRARPTCWPSTSSRSTRARSRPGCGRWWTAWHSSTRNSYRRRAADRAAPTVRRAVRRADRTTRLRSGVPPRIPCAGEPSGRHPCGVGAASGSAAAADRRVSSQMDTSAMTDSTMM